MAAGGSPRPDVDTPAETQLTSGAHANFAGFAEQHLFIQTKAGDLAPLRLNRSQKFRESLFTDMEAAGLPIRIWEAKARQLGCSTHVQGRMAWKCFTNKDESALVAAHADPSSRLIFQKAKLFYQHLPTELRPRSKYNNRQELDLRDPKGPSGLRSKFSVMTAASVEDARGGMYRQCHISEVAFFKRPEAFFLATLQTIPDEPGTMVYAESTCNGTGDFHHHMYLTSKVWEGWDEIPPWMELKRDNQGNPDSDFYALFSPWFLMEEYRQALRLPEDEFVASLDTDERELLDKFEGWVTLEHLQWRRSTIATKCGGSLERFHQEYPSTDAEAFSASGSPAFTQDIVREHRASRGCYCDLCRRPDYPARSPTNDCPPHRRFELVDATMNRRGLADRYWSSYKPSTVAAGDGRLSVWRDPCPGSKYMIGADVSLGGVGSDFDHAVVYDLHRLEQVAEWRGKVEIPDFADVLMLLSKHYNRAWLAPEISGIGAGLIAVLQRTHYPFLFRRQALDSTAGPTILLGWDTNRRTKPALVTAMQQLLRDDVITIRSQVVLEEMAQYRRTILLRPDGADSNEAKFDAPSGAHDDAVMAAMIGANCAFYMPGAGSEARTPDQGPKRGDEDQYGYTEDDWERIEARLDNPYDVSHQVNRTL